MGSALEAEVGLSALVGGRGGGVGGWGVWRREGGGGGWVWVLTYGFIEKN